MEAQIKLPENKTLTGKIRKAITRYNKLQGSVNDEKNENPSSHSKALAKFHSLVSPLTKAIERKGILSDYKAEDLDKQVLTLANNSPKFLEFFDSPAGEVIVAIGSAFLPEIMKVGKLIKSRQEE